MRIKQINSQSRRDFRADYECEHCGHIEKNVSGYDDSFFHQNVIPEMACKICHKKADETYRALAPKYSDDKII